MKQELKDLLFNLGCMGMGVSALGLITLGIVWYHGQS